MPGEGFLAGLSSVGGVSDGDGLTAELAAVGGDWDLGEALGAGFDGGGFGALEAGEQFLYGKDEEEVDDEGDDEEVDDGVEEVAVLDGRLMEGEDKIGEVGLTYDGGDKRSDDVFDERFSDRSESCADDDGDGEVDDVAAQDEVAKAFDHVASQGVHCVQEIMQIIRPRA